MEDVGRVDLRIGAVDCRNLADARAGADQLGAEFLADRGRIAIAILDVTMMRPTRSSLLNLLKLSSVRSSRS